MQIFETNFVENVIGQYPKTVLNNLLKDKTTGKNIIWATDEYSDLGDEYYAENEITVKAITGFHSGVIKPRITKNIETQQDRTKTKAEVMTPSWVCNKMNNVLDEDWFGRPDVFNTEKENGWKAITEKISFPKTSNWKDYVYSRKLEITCGEAPFITSRYDTTTGNLIPVFERIGFLDRKFRVISENTDSVEDWLTWAYKALESTYGYEYQGDNLLIARINVLQTFSENMTEHFGRMPDEKESVKASHIISWNLWQMDGLKKTTPLGTPEQEFYQINIFDVLGDEKSPAENKLTAPYCKIYDWRSDRSILFTSLENEAM